MDTQVAGDRDGRCRHTQEHQGDQWAPGGWRQQVGRGRIAPCTPRLQTELRPLWPEAPGSVVTCRAYTTSHHRTRHPGTQWKPRGTAWEGRTSQFLQLLNEEVTWFSRPDAGSRGGPRPAGARAAPHSSSMTAATVLCPKMKAPTSTETTPQASRQHLPSQRTHVNHALLQSFPQKSQTRVERS